MPRARRSDHETNFRPRIGKHKNGSFTQIGTSEGTNTHKSLESFSRPINTTAIQTTEMSSGRFAPFLVGAANGTSSNSSSTGLEENGETHITSQRDVVLDNPLECTQEIGRLSGLLSSLSQEDLNNPGRVLNDQVICPSAELNNPVPHRPGGLTSLVSQWGKKGDCLPVMDSSTFSPSWVQLFEKVGLSKAAAEYQGLIGKK